MKPNRSNAIMAAGLLALALALSPAYAAGTNEGYAQVNLVSDIATNAPHTDTNLVNPWGIVAGPDVVWVNDNGTGLTTAYAPSGKPFHFTIQVHGRSGAGTPSGLVFNQTGQFVLTNGSHHAPSTFLMAEEDGTIAAWNHHITGSNAVIVIDGGTNAVYKGLALAWGTNGAPQIYAANFHAGHVDVFDTSFHHVQSFTDTNVPALFAPFGIRNIRGKLFVTFAKQKLPDMHDDAAGAGNGFVDIFDVDGTLLRRFASHGALNSPWGLVVAPANFGKFSQALLVGNFGDGLINAYDLLTSKWLGHLTTPNGDDIVINGLWGLTFEREENSEHDCDFEAQRLYFSAGINDEADGLLGFIHVVPPVSHHGHDHEGNGHDED